MSIPALRALLCLAICSTSCARERPAAESTAEQSLSLVASRPLTPYPPGRWRLANPSELANVVLWASHIVIRHREVTNPEPCFNLGKWHSESAKVERSREDALRLIQQLRDQLAREPERFSELATQHSEDVATRALGGSLGGIQALQLTPWPVVLDVLAQTSPGALSEIIETEYGFHLFLRRSTPATEAVSGARIVIGHNEAPWLEHISKGDVPFRTRAEALALANDLYARAKADPETFASLVAQHSEHLDVVNGGDLGTWSTTEPSYYPREIELLSRLAVGAVAPPIDSKVGFEILRRTPARARQWYAIEQLSVPFEPPLSGEESPTKVAALAQIRELSRQLQEHPGRFGELQRKHCCVGAEQWEEGRGWPTLTAAVTRLELNEISREPVVSGSSYVLLRRIEPVTPKAPTVTHDLPAPAQPSLEPFIRSHAGAVIASVLAAGAEEARATLGLPSAMLAKVAEIQGDLGRFAELRAAEEKVAAYRATLAELSTALGPADYARYEALLNGHWERQMLLSN